MDTCSFAAFCDSEGCGQTECKLAVNNHAPDCQFNLHEVIFLRFVFASTGYTTYPMVRFNDDDSNNNKT